MFLVLYGVVGQDKSPKRLGKDNTKENKTFVILYSFHMNCLLDETIYLQKVVLDKNASHCQMASQSRFYVQFYLNGSFRDM